MQAPVNGDVATAHGPATAQPFGLLVDVPAPDAPPQATPSRHERKRNARRERVYDAAMELFTARGYEAVSMEDIAERADVARATVFNYFRYKKSFLDEWGQRRRALATEVLRSVESDHLSLRELLTRYFTALAALSTERREETTALMAASTHHLDLYADPPMAGDLRTLLDRARGPAKLPENVDPARASLLISTCYTATLTRWLNTEPPSDLTAELLQVLELLLTGIAPDRE